MKLLEIREKFNSDKEFVNAVDEQLKKLMTENPDFIYAEGGEDCKYNSGPPSNPDLCSGCIFGQAFQTLGWNDIKEMDFDLNINSLLTQFISKEMKTPIYWCKIQKIKILELLGVNYCGVLMNRVQKRKFRKIKARQNRIKKFGIKHGYSGYQIDCYILNLLSLIKNK